jgi:hypothetical protein
MARTGGRELLFRASRRDFTGFLAGLLTGTVAPVQLPGGMPTVSAKAAVQACGGQPAPTPHPPTMQQGERTVHQHLRRPRDLVAMRLQLTLTEPSGNRRHPLHATVLCGMPQPQTPLCQAGLAARRVAPAARPGAPPSRIGNKPVGSWAAEGATPRRTATWQPQPAQISSRRHRGRG